MTEKELKVEEEINEIVEKKYCKNTILCEKCKYKDDCMSYSAAGVFEKVAIKMILDLRAENEKLKANKK